VQIRLRSPALVLATTIVAVCACVAWTAPMAAAGAVSAHSGGDPTGPAVAGWTMAAHAAIVGGAAAPAGSFPWLAYVYDDLGAAAASCTGTVVAANLVLTAAHCVENISTGVADAATGFSVITGSLDWTDTTLRQVSAVTQVIPYNAVVETNEQGVNIVGDAALLVLATPTTAPAITIANSSDLALLQPGTAAAIGGWGVTAPTGATTPTTLQSATTVVQATAFCTTDIPDFDAAAQLCTIDAPADGVSFCNGDSGAPLIAESPASTWIDIGIASTSFTCDPALPDMFTRVDSIYSWVQGWMTALPAPIPTPPAATTTASAPTVPAQPEQGSYAGRSSQRSGHLDLTVTPSGVAQLKLEFNLHCPHRRRGPFVATDRAPLALSNGDGSWDFSTAFRNGTGWRYSITGSLSAFGTASGSLTVATRNEACRSGVVDWTASIPTG
jgi:secreted trypsin-like serine protease